jgi:hypothetical protein
MRTPRVTVVVLSMLAASGAFPRALRAQSCAAPSFGARADYPAGGGVPHALVTADLNRDGHLDLVTLRSGPSLAILLGDGAGGFGVPNPLGLPGSAQAVAVGDFDSDGIPDLAVARATANVEVLRGDGIGGFTPMASFAVNSGPFGVTVGDFDNNGKDDIVTSSTGLQATFVPGNGNGTFGAPVGVSQGFASIGVAHGDLDRNGDLDLVFVSNGTPNSVSAVLGNGNGTFGAAQQVALGAGPRSVIVAELDGNGIPDVAVAVGASVAVLLVDGAGALGAPTFLPPAGAPQRLAASDVDRDGDMDLVASDSTQVQLEVYLNDGTAGFPTSASFASASTPSGVVAADFDHDGRPDLAAAQQGTGDIGVRRNDFGIACLNASLGKLGPAFATGGPGFPHALALGDLNNDARLDALVTTSSSNNVVVSLGTLGGGLGAPTGFGMGLDPKALALGEFSSDGFLDVVTANAGTDDVSVRLGNGAGGFAAMATWAVGATPLGVAVGDFNGDGRRDIVTANSNSNDVSILLGDGTGGFASAGSFGTDTGARSVAVGDLNGDGRADLVVANRFSNTVCVLLGNGDGTFVPGGSFGVGSEPVFVILADLSGDAILDFAAADNAGNTVTIALGDGVGGFGGMSTLVLSGTNRFPTALAAADVNGDGILDLAVGAAQGSIDFVPSNGTVYVFLGTGGAAFGPPLLLENYYSPLAVALGDMSGDGRPDLVAPSQSIGSVHVSLGDGLGGFGPSTFSVGLGANLSHVITADFDRDGHLDLAMPSSNNSAVWVQRGDGAGGFTPLWSAQTPGDGPQFVVTADYDDDGWLDLAIGGSNSTRVYLGTGGGSFAFAPSATLFAGVWVRWMLTEDLDRDGAMDIVVVTDTTPGRVFTAFGNRNGTFVVGPTLTVGNSPFSAGLADVDRNGTLDILVACYNSNRVEIIPNNGNRTFGVQSSVPVPSNPFVLATGDFNEDGRTDFAVSAQSSPDLYVYRGNGTGGFAGPFVFAGFGFDVGVTDWNRDGHQDIFALDRDHSSITTLRGRGDGSFDGPVSWTADLRWPWRTAFGDYDEDGRADMAIVNQTDDTTAVVLNTNCVSRRLALATNVSTCGAAPAPLAPQPVVNIYDDGANPVQCDFTPVAAAIVPGSGTGGATLFGANNPVTPAGGVAAFTDLGIDLAGRAYQLSFTQGAASTLSRTFSLSLPPPMVTGPNQVCQTSPATFSAGPGYDGYSWTLDAAGPISTLQHVTVGPGLSVGLHSLNVTVKQDGCTSATPDFFSVAAPLSSATISLISGADGVCTTCPPAGQFEVFDSGGGTVTHRWGWRDTPGGAFNEITGETFTTYTLQASHINGATPGNYWLVAESTSTIGCGGPVFSNEWPITVYNQVLGDAVAVLTVTSKDGVNTLEWLNPVLGGYAATHIRYFTGPGCAFPTTPFEGTLLVADAGAYSGVHRMATHSGLVNGVAHCYSAFVEQGGPAFGDAKSTKGTPFDTSGPAKWSYATGASSMAPPGLSVKPGAPGGGNVYVGSGDGLVHGMVRGVGASSGLWPAGWTPAILGPVVQHRPAVVATSLIGGSTRVSFVAAQDGTINAIDADTGQVRWSTSIGSGAQGAPAGMFTAFGGNTDQILAGTRNSLSPHNALCALDVATGALDGCYDNGGSGMGLVIGGAALDYPGRRAYFTSRPGSASTTLWCVEVTGGAPTATCPGWIPRSYGGAAGFDAGPVMKGSRLYVGDGNGTVYALDPGDGGILWTFPTGDGAVKGFVFPDPFSSNLYFATSTKVWGIVDNGGSASLAWPEVTTIVNPSIALLAPGQPRLLVGGQEGPTKKLFQIDFTSAGPLGPPPTIQSVVLGDGASVVGSPAYDSGHNLVYVGTDAGIVYAVQMPLP